MVTKLFFNDLGSLKNSPKAILPALLLISLLFFGCAQNREKEELAQKIYVQAVDEYGDQKFDSCLDFAEKSISLKRDFYQARLLQAKVFYFQDKNSLAQKTIKKLVKQYPEYTEARIWKIRILLQAQEYDEAKKLLDTELSFNNTDWRVYYLYALLAQKQNNFNLRLSMQKHAEQFLQDGNKVYIDLAAVWLQLGLRDRAIDYLEKAKNLSSDEESIDRAIAHLKNGDDIL